MNNSKRVEIFYDSPPFGHYEFQVFPLPLSYLSYLLDSLIPICILFINVYVHMCIHTESRGFSVPQKHSRKNWSFLLIFDVELPKKKIERNPVVRQFGRSSFGLCVVRVGNAKPSVTQFSDSLMFRCISSLVDSALLHLTDVTKRTLVHAFLDRYKFRRALRSTACYFQHSTAEIIIERFNSKTNNCSPQLFKLN